MKRILCLCGALLVLEPAAARAGLDLTANSCNLDFGTTSGFIDCGGAGTLLVLGDWQSPVPIDSVVSMDVSLDLQENGLELSPFWHMEAGGCNEAGLEFTHRRPTVICSRSFNTWGGDSSGSAMTYVVVGATSPNRARILATCFRATTRPLAHVNPTQNMFGFQIVVSAENAVESGGTCSGCTDGMTIVWNGCSVYNVNSQPTPESMPTVITGPGYVSNCLELNGGNGCFVVAARNRTWGQLKSLYR